MEIIFAGVLLGVLVVGGCASILAYMNQWQQTAEAELMAQAEEIERQRDQEHAKRRADQELAKAQSLRRIREAEEQSQVAIAQAIELARESASDRYRASPKANTLEELNELLKKAQLNYEHPGRVLTVRVVASPSGYVRFEWMLHPRFVCPLRVECMRAGHILFVNYAHRGSFVDIVPRGRDHRYCFHAYDGKRDEEPEFTFVVRVPTEKQWARKVGEQAAEPIDKEAERAERISKKIQAVIAEEQLWAKGRQQGYGIIEAAGGSELEQRRQKAAFDAKLLEERENEEPKAE